MNTNRYDYRILMKDFEHGGCKIKSGSLVWVCGALKESGETVAVIENHCLYMEVPTKMPTDIFTHETFYPFGTWLQPQDKGDNL